MELITPAEYARRRGVSDVAVHKALRAGRISLIHGKIDPEVADIQWEKNTRKRVDYHSPEKPDKHSAGESQHTSKIWEHRERREAAEAELKEIELETALGNLVAMAEVQTAQFGKARAVRDAMLSLPDRLAPLLAATSSADECHKLLITEIRAALQQLAESMIEVQQEAAA